MTGNGHLWDETTNELKIFCALCLVNCNECFLLNEVIMHGRLKLLNVRRRFCALKTICLNIFMNNVFANSCKLFEL